MSEIYYGIEYTNTAGERKIWTGRTTLGQLEGFRTKTCAEEALKRVESWQKDPKIIQLRWDTCSVDDFEVS